MTTLARGLDAECDREMRLAGADRSGEEHVFGAPDPLAARELEHELRVDAVGRGEVEAVDRLVLGGARRVESLLDRRVGARRELGGEHLVEILLVRPALLACLASESLEGASEPRHLERPCLRADEIGRGVRAAHDATPSSAS